MPSLNVGVAALSFEVNYPNVDGQIEITVPSNVPQLGGKVYTLPSFSLSVKSPSTQIPVNMPQFSGQISVSLDFTNCESERRERTR